VRDIDPPAGSPEHSDAGANFQIPDESIDFGCIHSSIGCCIGRLLHP
jgi:hypothetical protein